MLNMQPRPLIPALVQQWDYAIYNSMMECVSIMDGGVFMSSLIVVSV